MPISTLVLFDIDGTLVQSGRAGVRGMNRAFQLLYGREQALDGVPVAGRTDRAIVTQVMRAIGTEPSDAEIERLRDAYFENLRVEIGKPSTDPSGVLPGVVALVAALAERSDVAVGLLTGNFHGGARIKLGHFALWEHFSMGAFGDAHLDRRALVPVAIEQARATGLGEIAAGQVVVIGDTPLDVDCAQANGARSIAVATGLYDLATLAATGADLTVKTLEDVEMISRWIQNEGPT